MSSTEPYAQPSLVQGTDDSGVPEGKGRAGRWLARYWLAPVIMMVALYAGLPWLAPLFMEAGWTRAGHLIYQLYSTQCHQLPQRSFFLFGSRPMYTLADIQAIGYISTNPLELRQFIGNPVVGWKVAWSDRMVAMYSSIVLWAVILFGLLHNRLLPLSGRGLLLLLLPMIVDGTTHMISDFVGGIGGGFRDSNGWLVDLTNGVFTANFYAGDALGSFNSSMRLLSGVLFGLATVWFLVPRIQSSLNHE